MSRGLGRVQRRVLAVLNEQMGDEGLPVTELKTLLGGDRSNGRRAIRSLALRGWLEELTVGDERRVRLTFWGAMAATPLPERKDPRAEIEAIQAKWAEESRNLALMREQARKEKAEAEARWRRRRHPRRRRRLGPVQKRILAILRQGIDGQFVAMETTYLKSLVGGDRCNLRRSIVSLLEVRLIEERTVDGQRYYELTLFGFMYAVPLDPSTAPRLLDL